MSPIVTLTLNPAVDKNCTVNRVVPERKLRCHQPSHDPGGGGLNVARAIKELRGDVKAFWTCGGAIGDLLKDQIDREGVAQQPIPIKAMTRENLIVFENSTGQQFRFGMPGARLTSQEIEECQNVLRDLNPPPEYLVLSGSLPPDVPPDLYGQIAQSMPSSCRVVLDTSGPALVEGISIKDSVYLIKPNVRELGHLAECEIEDDSQIEEVARRLITQSRVKVVVTSLGSGGAALTTADDHRLIRAPTVKIRSKVGAGDSMVAGIVVALARNASLLDAVCYGVAAGSAAVMTEGTALCRREDTESLYQKMC